ncbi:hypothetical protein [Neolewinella xylanilytica]|uniref:hypothetical protein n=1 Tax=Neolewinella xylanilytica TaxID=1514080 RepID=UPI0011B0250B|nr:hypothetical protein [Neolewinella xylanilytica]
MAKTRDEDVDYEIFRCHEEADGGFLSRDFAMFQSRDFEGCELKQVESLLQIDLSVYQKFPGNYSLDTGELEYQLYLAEEKQDLNQMAAIERKMEEAEELWHQTYDTNNEGWTTVAEFRKVTRNLLDKLATEQDISDRVVPPPGWDYPWGDYFAKSNLGIGADSLVKDLQALLIDLKCIESAGVNYVALYGG